MARTYEELSSIVADRLIERLDCIGLEQFIISMNQYQNEFVTLDSDFFDGIGPDKISPEDVQYLLTHPMP